LGLSSEEAELAEPHSVDPLKLMVLRWQIDSSVSRRWFWIARNTPEIRRVWDIFQIREFRAFSLGVEDAIRPAAGSKTPPIFEV
jgi:hypothetical protein